MFRQSSRLLHVQDFNGSSSPAASEAGQIPSGLLPSAPRRTCASMRLLSRSSSSASSAARR